MQKCRQQQGKECESTSNGCITDPKVELIGVKTRKSFRHQPGDKSVVVSYVWVEALEDRDIASEHVHESCRTNNVAS